MKDSSLIVEPPINITEDDFEIIIEDNGFENNIVVDGFEHIEVDKARNDLNQMSFGFLIQSLETKSSLPTNDSLQSFIVQNGKCIIEVDVFATNFM